MSGPRDGADEARWAGIFSRGRDAVLVLNRRRRVLYVNGSWEQLTQVNAAEARGITCTLRETGQSNSSLARTLAPPDEVLAGRAVHVRRPSPGQMAGPPWWDIDFLPIMGDGRLIGVIGRIRVVEGQTAAARAILPAALAKLRSEVLGQFSFAGLESAAPGVRRAVAQARLVANHGCHATIIGAPGVGKRTLARTIHVHSARCDLPCVMLDAARLPASAIRAALFGPAGRDLPDWAGLIYLHAPARMPLDLQSEIAGRLADRPLVTLGCPTNPHDDIRSGTLSADLFTTFGMVVIELPSLRERCDDLPNLLNAIARHLDKELTPTPSAWAALQLHDWPGNIAELVELVNSIPGPSAEVADLPVAIRRPVTQEPPPLPALPPLDQLLERIEARMIRLALARASGNKSKAAELLGVWRPRLLRRLEALGITSGEE